MPVITPPAPRLAALCLSLALLGTAPVALAAPATQEATKTVSARKAALTKEKRAAASATGSKKAGQNKAAKASRSAQASAKPAPAKARGRRAPPLGPVLIKSSTSTGLFSCPYQ